MTWYPTIQTCRFCKGYSHDGTNSMVKYGTRHYAHYHCFLEAGKKLYDLWAWQINLFPYRLLQKHGLEAEATALIAAEKRT